MAGDHSARMAWNIFGRREPQAISGGSYRAEAPPHIGNRRKNCWWEPIYDPSVTLEPEPYDWDLGRDAGPSRRYIAGTTLGACITPGDTYTVKSVTFRECDFQGQFLANPVILFDQCQFIGCDFAYSAWFGAHFRGCSFIDSSLSLATFERCEFRDCIWTRVGLASRSEFAKTHINNPKALIKSSISRSDPKDTSWRHKLYQWHRLLGTRAHVLRSLMLSHSSVGDERTYYQTVKMHELQRCEANIGECLYRFGFGSPVEKILAVFTFVLELAGYLTMVLLGFINKWGESVSRPAIILAATAAVFSQIYSRADFRTEIVRPLQKSFDITLLIGYGNQAVPADTGLSMVQNLHAAIALLVYTMFLTTLVSKLARVR